MDDTTVATQDNPDVYFTSTQDNPDVYFTSADDASPGTPPVIRPDSEQESYTTEDGTTMYSIHTDYLGEDVDRSAMNMPQTPGYTNVTHYNDDAEKEESLAYVDEDGRYRSSDGSLLDSAATENIHARGIGGHLYTWTRAARATWSTPRRSGTS